MDTTSISHSVEDVYRWIEQQKIEHTCQGCGNCCNFKEFDHLLFVTGVELLHFANAIGTENIKLMNQGICPYRRENKCTVYKNRFAGCRIFQCTGDTEKQSEVMEKALQKLKQISDKFAVEYSYTDLQRGLNYLKEIETRNL